MKLTANTLTIILLVSAGILQPKLTGSLRLVRELRRGEHVMCTSTAVQVAAPSAVVASLEVVGGRSRSARDQY